MVKRYKEGEAINPGRFLVDHGAKPKKSKAPYIMRDHYNGPLAYESPITGRKIDSRIERQKEMKEHNVREVDPSERSFQRETDRHIDPKLAKKHGVNLDKYNARKKD